MANATTRQKLEQGRAAFAFKQAAAGYTEYKKEYAQAAKKLPMMIKTNGLGAALAFLFSKQKVWGTVLNHIEAWVNSTDNLKTHLIYKETEGSNLVQKILHLDSNSYRIVTIEILAYLNWLRRFAEGIAKEKEIQEKAKNKNNG
ncbi:type III-B CRISPR module-associated protein Cmr5 [Sphingobacteriales bacterium UPWRP_1]|nr:type III-B CRISPR module-associated protein Cmr5 [Sphingobacteriales bacterium UPWRP_1]